MKKKGLPEIIADIKLTIYRIDMFLARIDNRIKTLEDLSLYNIGRFNYLSKAYYKEIEINKNLMINLLRVKIILEILEIRLETLMMLNSLREYIYPVVKALESIKGNLGNSIEFGPLIDDILLNLKPIVTSDAKPILNESEEVRKIIEEAEKVATEELREKYKVPT
ncbi:cell division protein CdvB3 [Sulfurisphaera javensis]|uniref:Cell division protein CdvB3 n=1 Tax=Sulfurisphaera javensis TaxID=2049879 RepID=A0AAT9GV88_9CREN